MKNKKLLLVLLMFLMVLAFFGCTETPKLLTPEKLAISQDGRISWNAVENATGYRVTIGSNSYTVASTFYQVSDTSENFTCQVVAIANGYEDSDPATATFTVPEPPDEKEIPDDAKLSARSASAVINDDEFDAFDFTTLFSIRNENQTFPVKAEYLDLSHLSKEDGGYVVCTVEEQIARIEITIHKRVHHLTVSLDSVTVFVDETAHHDFLQYFKATTDGQTVPITPDMVTSTVKSVAGRYLYTVNFRGESKNLIVNVVDRVVIKASRPAITINDYELETYDFASLFAMTVNGQRVKVTDDYIDKSQVAVGKTGEVVCSNGTARDSISVTVNKNVYEVNLKTAEITLHFSVAEDYDYLSLFTATHNGKEVDIEPSMVNNAVIPQEGVYTFTVTFRDASKTLTVNITNEHQVAFVINYPNLEIAADKTESFDYSKLFSLYVDGKSVKVTSQMLDVSALTGVVAGQTYEVGVSYTDGNGKEHTAAASVKVVTETAVTIQARNVVTYPNAAPVDLLSLFTITDGIETVPVTSDMLSGNVDYSKEGDNIITCMYGTVSAQAVVTVKRGVVINVKSDVITVRVGTDKETYFFEDDFELIVNGIKIANIFPFLDVSSVDFTAAGEYTATLSVGYFDGECKVPATPKPSADLQVFTAQIVYKVVERLVNVSFVSDPVTLTVGSSFNPLSNVRLTVNGYNYTLVTNKDYASRPLNCYAEFDTSVDTSAAGSQQVSVKLYIDGPDSDPFVAQFVVRVVSTAQLTAYDKIIFVGDTLYTTDLFAITDGGESVPVTAQMVSGYVDTFTAGVYTVELNYKGASVTSRVAVLEQSVRGSYTTFATTIATEAEEDEEGNELTSSVPSRYYGALSFDVSGIIADGRIVSVIKIVDEHQFIVSIGNNDYSMYMFDGIVVLNPDNSLKIGFNNNKRPLIYFNDSVWNADRESGKLIVNYGDNHVLATTFISYTIEVYTVTSKTDGSSRKIALYVGLVNKNSFDTIYRVSWGDVSVSDGFVQQGGQVGTLIYENNAYAFTMRNMVIAKVNRSSDAPPPYTGTFKNGNDRLVIGGNGSVTYTTASGISVSVSKNDISAMKNGGIFADNTVVIYALDVDVNSGKWYCYKFNVDPANKTFTVEQKDCLYGLYCFGNSYLFLDGYGKGLVSYDTSSNVALQLTYEFNPDNREVTIEYFNHYAYPQYGDGASFYLLDTLNVLVVKEMYDANLTGKEYVNAHISDGAIVRFETVNLCNVSRLEILNYVTVITQYGELTYEQKKNNVVSVNSVDRYQSGVYQITVNVSVGGQTVKCYYAVQVFVALDPAPELARDYGSSVINGDAAKLQIDKFGLARLIYDGVEFNGNVQYYGGDRFVVRAKNRADLNVVIQGRSVADGIIYVQCLGAVNFFDYFTTGSFNVVGDGTHVLRKITVDGKDTFIWASNLSSAGDIVEVEALSENQYVLSSSDGNTYVVQIDKWGSASEGLTLSDNIRGQYVNVDDVTLILDGFGNATLNDGNGTYVINANGSVTVIVGSEMAVFTLNAKEGTFAQVDVALGNALVEGKTFGANHTFVCEGYPYSALTRFIFGEDGKVTVTSASSEHDEGEDQCTEDAGYKPPFAPSKTNQGTYSVFLDVVTVTVTGEGGTVYTFTFQIVDIFAANRFVCVSTNVASDAHGYFAVGTVFVGYKM